MVNSNDCSGLSDTNCSLRFEVDLSGNPYCLFKEHKMVVVPLLSVSRNFKITPSVDPWSSTTIPEFKDHDRSIKRGPGYMPRLRVVIWNNKLSFLFHDIRRVQGNSMPFVGVSKSFCTGLS